MSHGLQLERGPWDDVVHSGVEWEVFGVLDGIFFFLFFFSLVGLVGVFLQYR